ncbi:Protein cornichon-like 4 [Vitis vinifera]|uniref:Protein cornichon-like 4 n=1 Tax=Vitis vinifera TaxID=29760 RepID=A0A438E086_VITVI|nr:Protein cornichon-like 4 [Vitis vinifera]RVX00933.1 Protein cornichon-like 4 [Vitis vinifera]
MGDLMSWLLSFFFHGSLVGLIGYQVKLFFILPWTFLPISVSWFLFSRIVLWYMRRQHLLDVTEIFNQLNREKQLRIFKLVHLIVLLTTSIFWYCDKMIWSIGGI